MPEPIITWAPPASITFGTVLSGTQFNATADVPGTFVYNPASGRVLSVGSHTLDLTVTPDDDGIYTAAYAQRSITVSKAASTINLEGLSTIFDGTAKTVRASVQDLVVTTFAGSFGFSSTLPFRFDEMVLAARFSSPWGAALDTAGNVYVADGIAVRKITPAGLVTTMAGDHFSSGSTDGTGSNARFNQLRGVGVDSAGNAFVADTGNNTIRKITPAGVVTTFAGLAGSPGSTDGIGGTARFNQPSGVAIDGADDIYVVDAGNHTIRKITAAGMVTTLAGSAGNAGSADGAGSVARFHYPEGVAVDSAGTVYVADTSNYEIRKITPAGVVTTMAGDYSDNGTTDGTGSVARFGLPIGIAVDGVGNVYVGDAFYRTIRKITPDGMVTTPAGTAGVMGSADGAGPAAQFSSPDGLAADSMGNVYVTDTNNGLIRKITGVSATFTVTYNGSSTAPTDPGSYTVVSTLNDPNYQGSSSGTLVISKVAALVSLGGLSATYDGLAHAATATTTPAGLLVDLTYDGSVAAPTNSGSYTVVGTISDTHYHGSASEVLTISKAAPVITWANPSAISYGVALSATQLNASANAPGTLGYATAAGAVLNAGTHSLGVTFTPTDSANYNGATKSVDLAVNKATLTVSAADKSRIYGAADPVFTAVISGFVNSDTDSVVTGAPAFTTPASSWSSVGTYAIIPAAGTLGANNYSFSLFNDGRLTVQKAPLTVTADNKARLQGTANPALTVSYAGFVNGDGASSLTTQPAASVLAEISSPIGSYPIAPVGGTSANYSFVYVNGLLSVVNESIAPSSAVVTITVE